MCDFWKRPKRHVPFDVVVGLLDTIADKWPHSEVRFTGGEPCLHPRFIEILHEVRQRHLFVSTITNGTVFTNPQIMDKKIDRFFLSIDSPLSYDQKAIRGVYIYPESVRPEYDIVANVILSTLNKNNVTRIPRWMKERGIRAINLIPMKTNRYKLRPKILYTLLAKMLHKCIDFGIVHFIEGMPWNGVDSKTAIQVLFQTRSSAECRIRQHVRFIHMNGNSYCCNSTPHRTLFDPNHVQKSRRYDECPIYVSGQCDYSNIIFNELATMGEMQ